MQARYKNVLMWALYALLFLLVMVVQTVVFGRARFWDTKLCLIPVAVVCVAMYTGAESGGVFGLAAGTFWCLSGADGGGMLIVLCTLCAVCAGYLCERVFNRNLVSALMMSLMALTACQLTLFALKCYLGQSGADGWLLLLRQILLSMAACPPVTLAAWAIRKAGA